MRESAWAKPQEVQVRVLPTGVPPPTSFLVHRVFPTGRCVWVIGKSGARTASRFKSCAAGQPVDDATRLLSVVPFRMGRCALVIELGSSNCDRAARENEKMRVRFPSRNIDAVSCPSFSIFDWSQDWVIVDNDVVAGSSPASGSRRRSSSAVEHVIPGSILIRRVFRGP